MFFRNFTIQGSWNFERQMNLGCMYSMAPFLDKLYRDEPEEKKKAYKRHMVFFNNNMYVNTFVLGILGAMEEEHANHEDSFNVESINAMKTSLMGPMAGIGDSIFQGTWRIICFGLGASLAVNGSILGPILAFLLYNIPAMGCQYFGTFFGYNAGNKYLTKIYENGLMDKLMFAINVIGLMLVGAMVASMVNLKTGIVIPSGGEGYKLQKLFDSLLPQALSLGLTGLFYWLLNKKINSNLILIAAVVISFILSYFKIIS